MEKTKNKKKKEQLPPRKRIKVSIIRQQGLKKKKGKDWQFEQAIIVFFPRGGGIGTCLPILVPWFLRGDPRTMTSYEAWQGDDTLASN